MSQSHQGHRSHASARGSTLLARAGALALALSFGAQPGCASEPDLPPTPEAAVRAFARALNRAKFDEAYALMSSDYRKRVSFAQWKRRLTENPQETLDVSNALSGVRSTAEQRAVIAYDDGAQLELRREGERWFLTSNVVDFYDQSTPRAALRAFVRAMERKRYDVVMRLIPSADKEGITAERMEQAWTGDERESVERMLSVLREHLEDPIEVIGNHATMPYGDHARVQFVREGEVWKIEDPE
jgi:hypothetical protein